MNIRNRQPILRLILAFLALSILSVDAQVDFFGIQKGPSYNQTVDDTPPTVANNYGLFAFFNTTNPGDATSFTVTDTNTGASFDATGSGTSFGGTQNYSGLGSNAANKAAMDGDFVPGDSYSITVNGGALDGQTDSLPNYADQYPGQMYLTGSGITNALAINPNADYTINVGYAATDISDATLGNSQAFAIFDQTTGSFLYNVYQNSPGQSAYAFEVPSSFLQTLNPSDSYVGQLTDFEILSSAPSNDFAGPSSDAFTQTTIFDMVIEAIPEPSQWGALVFLGTIAAFGLRRAQRVER